MTDTNRTSDRKVAPLRDVMFDSTNKGNAWQYPFRVLTLSCGHHIFRQPAKKPQKRARCQECAE